MFEPPTRTAFLLRDFKPDWFIAGGWAIDLFLERETRPHRDIEIAVFRRDHPALQNFFKDRILKKAIGGRLVEWRAGEFLKLPVHEIHCFDKGAKEPFLEVLLNESDGAEWVYRRDRRITRPLSQIFLANGSGIKFLRPEIVLLYKSKNPREKDERDFRAVEKRLDPESRNWLENALSVCCPHHRWLPALTGRAN